MSPLSWIYAFSCYGTAGRGRQCSLILFLEYPKDIGNHGINEEIAFQPSVDVKINKSVCSEQRKMLRYIGLAYLKKLFKIAHAFDPFEKFFKYLYSHRVGDRS